VVAEFISSFAAVPLCRCMWLWPVLCGCGLFCVAAVVAEFISSFAVVQL